MIDSLENEKSRRNFLLGLLGSGAALAGAALAPEPETPPKRFLVGHHFWNWDHAWNKGEFLEKRLQLTKETGYEGFEAKPAEIGRPADEVRERCAALGIQCVAIGAGGKEGIDYAHAAGAKIVRAGVPKEEARRWLDYAGERGIILTVHPHVAGPGAAGAVETREDLLR